MQLEGTFQQFPLRELIEMAVYSSVSGILEVQVGVSVGRIYFRDGLPQHAEADGMTGIDAIGRMFAEQNASFRFIANSEPVTPTLWMDPWELIALAEHQAKTWVKIRAYIPNLSLIPVLRGPVDAGQISISEDHWTLIRAIDGQLSIIDLARATNIPAIDLCIGILILAHKGLVTLRRAPVTPAGAATNAAAPRDGFFERLIARTMEEERRRSEPRITQPRISDPKQPEPRQTEPRFKSDPNRRD